MAKDPTVNPVPVFNFKPTAEQKQQLSDSLDKLDALEKMIEAGEKAGLAMANLKEQLRQAKGIVQLAKQAADELG